MHLNLTAAAMRRNLIAIHRRHMREWALLWRQWRNVPDVAHVMLNTAITRRNGANQEASL